MLIQLSRDLWWDNFVYWIAVNCRNEEYIFQVYTIYTGGISICLFGSTLQRARGAVHSLGKHLDSKQDWIDCLLNVLLLGRCSGLGLRCRGTHYHPEIWPVCLIRMKVYVAVATAGSSDVYGLAMAMAIAILRLSRFDWYVWRCIWPDRRMYMAVATAGPSDVYGVAVTTAICICIRTNQTRTICLAVYTCAALVGPYKPLRPCPNRLQP